MTATHGARTHDFLLHNRVVQAAPTFVNPIDGLGQHELSATSSTTLNVAVKQLRSHAAPQTAPDLGDELNTRGKYDGFLENISDENLDWFFENIGTGAAGRREAGSSSNAALRDLISNEQIAPSSVQQSRQSGENALRTSVSPHTSPRRQSSPQSDALAQRMRQEVHIGEPSQSWSSHLRDARSQQEATAQKKAQEDLNAEFVWPSSPYSPGYTPSPSPPGSPRAPSPPRSPRPPASPESPRLPSSPKGKRKVEEAESSSSASQQNKNRRNGDKWWDQEKYKGWSFE